LKQENQMRVGKFLSVGLIAVMFSAPAISAPLQGAIGNSMAAPSTTEKVWCHHCGGGDGGAGLGALIGGVVGGVIAAGAVSAAASQNAANDAAAQQHAAACAQRYHSYDPASNTFQAKDGRRLPCQWVVVITRKSCGRTPQLLERFRAKWAPVRVKKTRQN
jgi:BA14K-like protein